MANATESPNLNITELVSQLEPVIVANREIGESERTLPNPVALAARESGLFRLLSPQDYGGSEARLVDYMTMVESVARLDGATAWVFANLTAGAALTAYLPIETARHLHKDRESLVIAGAIAPKGRATPVEGGYRVSGRWPLVSGARQADWIGTAAVVFDGPAPRMGPHGGPMVMMFLQDPQDCRFIDTWDSLGLRGTGSIDVALDDVFVPEGRLFPVFGGRPFVSGSLYRAGAMTIFSLGLCSVMLGIARDAIDAFISLALQKTPTMSQTGLATRPTIHAEVARAEATLASARAYLFEAAREITAALEAGDDMNDGLEATRRLACVNAGQAARGVVDSIHSLAGSTPIYTGNRIERCLRDVHTAAQHIVASPVWWEKTGQSYFGLGLGTP